MVTPDISARMPAVNFARASVTVCGGIAAAIAAAWLPTGAARAAPRSSASLGTSGLSCGVAAVGGRVRLGAVVPSGL